MFFIMSYASFVLAELASLTGNAGCNNNNNNSTVEPIKEPPRT